MSSCLVTLLFTGHSEQKEKAKLPGTKKFLVTQSSILKMLSEAVKSYSGVAEFIIDQTVLNKEGEVLFAFSLIFIRVQHADL